MLLLCAFVIGSLLKTRKIGRNITNRVLTHAAGCKRQQGRDSNVARIISQASINCKAVADAKQMRWNSMNTCNRCLIEIPCGSFCFLLDVIWHYDIFFCLYICFLHHNFFFIPEKWREYPVRRRQFCGHKCLVDARGQRRTARLVLDGRKALVTQIATCCNLDGLQQ